MRWSVPVFETARDYLEVIEAHLIASSVVKSFHLLRQETLGDVGLYRLRAELIDDSELTMFERFRIVGNQAETEKYSFHWQSSDGALIRCWDNAPHHPQLPSFPHHVHEGANSNVLPHEPMNGLSAMREIKAALKE